ncbi:hypothetical protein SHKM778_82560 [Streptomyces sp. KM77-8]|uniref:Uncharacterized protein n=1 Tax=Streptomyces haneummycinicus TaxID=3074435 RepID=A0AAT9HXE3_9ACTN
MEKPGSGISARFAAMRVVAQAPAAGSGLEASCRHLTPTSIQPAQKPLPARAGLKKDLSQSRRKAYEAREKYRMEPPELRRAVEAARATAEELGLDTDDVTVIHNSDRVVLRLLPCDVLARVAPPGHLADSEFEVEVARTLATTDAPVAELDPRVAPKVHVRDTFALSLWTYYEPLGTEIPRPPTRTRSYDTTRPCAAPT